MEEIQEPRERLAAACFLMLAQGRVQALGQLYDALARDLYGYIKSIVGTPADAEDVFQEVFAKLASLGEKAIRVEKPLCYVFAMARNESFRAIKKRGESKERAIEEGLLETLAERGEQQCAFTPREVEAALSTLPVEQREVVVLKIYDGFTFAQIGELTNVSHNTAASRYRYALEKLAHKMGGASGSGQ